MEQNNLKRFNALSLLFFSIICFISVINNCALATTSPSTEDPVQFLHSITDKVLTELKHNHDANRSAEEVHKIVDNFIMPNVDFDEMCKWIIGRSQWAKASDTDKKEFITELKKLLTKTYSNTLNDYSEEKVEFQHYNGKTDIKRIQIKSTVVRPKKENLSIDYRLVATDQNSWKVYDLIIEGVSILQGFRAQFSDDARMYGLKSVIVKIREHNNQTTAS